MTDCSRVLVVIALLLGWASQSLAGGLTEKEVIKLADTEAKKDGWKLSHYRREVHYNYIRADDTWVVFYEGKRDQKGSVEVGDHFTVYISNKTRKLYLMPGR